MFGGIKTKLHDMSTIGKLCEIAELHALQDGQKRPGAEHFLLAALDLEDGTARLAFERVGANPEGVKRAIAHQYAAALHAMGFTGPTPDRDDDVAPRRSEPGMYHAAASGQEVMQALASSRQRHAPLLGAHVVAIVAAMPHGVGARALRAMGVDAEALRAAAEGVAARA